MMSILKHGQKVLLFLYQIKVPSGTVAVTLRLKKHSKL